ncbi:CDP-alcohol phosphatidyltransferase family protein [bacterium]|nr:CDP-alcohol phosphatidyltransferase family protein [bacterium]
MDRKALREWAQQRVRPLVLALDRLGLTPNAVSLLGLLISIVAGWIAARGGLFLGALVLLVGSVFDMLDGNLARLQGKVSRQGAFLDSNFDRLAEAAVFTGLAWYYMDALTWPDHGAVVLVMLTLIGSLTTSYARARAEGLGTTCFGGWLQRPERMALLIAGMLLGRHVLKMVLLLLAIVTILTTVQRIASTSRKLRQEEDAVLVAGPDQGDE